MNLTSTSFLRIHQSTDQQFIHSMDDEWDDTQTLLLLECIDKYGTDWKMISNLCQKSENECVKHFIQQDYGDDVQSDDFEISDLFMNASNPLLCFLHTVGNSLNQG